MTLLTILLAIIAIYALFGLFFGILYALRIAPARDPVAAAAPLRVRCLFIFGAIALWPLLIHSQAAPSTPAGSQEQQGANP